MRTFWTWLVGAIEPHRSEVCGRFEALPPIPEAGRMCVRTEPQPIRYQTKPMSIEEWRDKHGQEMSA